MSDHSREQLFVATKTKDLSSSTSTKPQQQLASCNQQQQQRQQQKAAGAGESNLLSCSTTSSSSTSKYLSIELNNNTIVQSEKPSESLKMMDSAASKQHASKTSRRPEQAATANGSLAAALAGSGTTTSTPSYASIFTSHAYNRSIPSPPQETPQRQKLTQLNSAPPPPVSTAAAAAAAVSTRRGSKLRKQEAADDTLEIPTLRSLDSRQSLSQKKLSTFEFADSDDVKQHDDDEDSRNDSNLDEEQEDEEESDDLRDEKRPFKSQPATLALLKHSKANRRGNLSASNQLQTSSHRCRSSSSSAAGARKSAIRCTAAADGELEPPMQSPYTKISFSESRPPSFGTCQNFYRLHPAEQQQQHQFAANGGSGKLEGWQIPVCARCNCTKCTKKLNKVNELMATGCASNTIQMDPYASKVYTRTKSIHLMLKSIILVLLTLLLLMVFIGIIMATHYLPSVFDKVLNVSRSFNVTIAGR